MPGPFATKRGNTSVIAEGVSPAHQHGKIAASGNGWIQGTRAVSVSFNYLKARVTYPATVRTSPHGDFLLVLAHVREPGV